MPIRKTHDHGLSKDCTTIKELRRACVETDHAESSMHASIGVAHANRVHLLQTPGEMAANARMVIMTKRRIGGKDPGRIRERPWTNRSLLHLGHSRGKNDRCS